MGLGSGYGIEQATFALRLLRRLREDDRDILHVQDPLLALIVQRAHSLGLVPTRVILAHGTEEPLSFQRKIRFLQHLAPWHQDQARSGGADRPTWTVIPNFIDTERFSPGRETDLRTELNIPPDGLVVLTVAAIKRPHKRIDYVIDEMARLIQQKPALPIWLVVAGGQEKETDELMAWGRSRLGNRVRFLVRFPRHRMPQLYRTADAFVLGSLMEMMPIALLEASASGLPCLVHRHPLLEWMVGPGGVVADISAPGALAAQLRTWWTTRRAAGSLAPGHAGTVRHTSAWNTLLHRCWSITVSFSRTPTISSYKIESRSGEFFCGSFGFPGLGIRSAGVPRSRTRLSERSPPHKEQRAMSLWHWLFPKEPTTGQRRVQLSVEQLESRLVPYALTGNAWPHPNLITISFEPDGTNLGGVTSNLFSVFDARFGSPSVWENVILQAAQQWAQQTNVNFTVVPDSGAPTGSGNDQQGDPTMGDIRVGGFAFSDGSLAMTYLPPPQNNYSLAGDMAFNTAAPFHIGSTYDLFTVAMHEFGHALGLGESSNPTAVEYTYYSGIKKGLAPDDVNGIQAIYGARQPDSFDTGAGNNAFGTATNLNSYVNPTSLTAVLTGLDVTTTSDVDYFKVNAPVGTNGTFQVSVQSQGLSLLAPTLNVYNAQQQLVGSVSGSGQYGTTLTVTLNNVTAGQQFFVRVAGADTSAFGTGAYALVLNFGPNPAPAVPLPITTTPNGSPLSAGGGLPQEPFIWSAGLPIGREDYHLSANPQTNLPPALLGWLGGSGSSASTNNASTGNSTAAAAALNAVFSLQGAPTSSNGMLAAVSNGLSNPLIDPSLVAAFWASVGGN